MNRRAEFSRKQAQRLFSLAEQCVDPQIRDQGECEREQYTKAGTMSSIGWDYDAFRPDIALAFCWIGLRAVCRKTQGRSVLRAGPNNSSRELVD
jgi:hypothetical protein